MREFVSPLTVNATGVLSARLSSSACGASPINLTVVNNTGDNAGTATLTLPTGASTVNGVYTLTLKNGCGCYTQLVWLRPCVPPSIPGIYDGDGGIDEPIETCPADPTCGCPCPC